MLDALLLILASDGAVQTVDQALAEPVPSQMSQKEIRAYNAKLPRDHPYYIRCISRQETGSLVKRSYTCRTNKAWSTADVQGNQNARETVEAMTGKASNTN